MRFVGQVLTAAALLVSACEKSKPPEPAPSPSPIATTPPPPAKANVGKLGEKKPAPERVVAIGDLHGDLDAARKALKLAGAIDDKDAWIGGKLVVVQTGDEIDRGDDDRKILDLFEQLKKEAPKTGGEVIPMLGNHELMNGELDFRYVTKGAFTAFSDVTPKDPSIAAKASDREASERGRASAFLPGGTYARLLADRPVIARVGDSIFVHGGVLPKHVKVGLDSLNDGARKWLLGEKESLPKELKQEDAPTWTRMYSEAPAPRDCDVLKEALTMLDAKRMVVGHTVQKPDIAPACDEKVWRIDVGMSAYYKGQIEVLELKGDQVKILK